MKSPKSYLKSASLFFAGFAAASVLFTGSSHFPEARAADQYSCIKKGLEIYGMTGNIPSPKFTLVYRAPSCLRSAGYTIKRVSMFGSEIAVDYEKP